MKNNKHKLVLLIILILSKTLFSQEIILKGKVRNENTFEGIANVNIFIKEINIGRVSNEKGVFHLHISNPLRECLVTFEHIGFDTLRVSLKEAQKQEIFNLKPRLIQAPEIIVEAERDRPEIIKDLPQL